MVADSKPQRRRGQGGRKEETKNEGLKAPLQRRGQGSRKEEAKNEGIKGHTSLLIHLTEESPTWYLVGKQQPERNEVLLTSQELKKNTQAMVEKYRSQGDEIFRVEAQLALSANKSKDDKWVESTMRKGTLKDRIAAMSVVLSQSPVHQFHVFQQLMDMTRPGTNSRVAQLAAEAIVDLFLNAYMPKDRKLVTMPQRPLYKYEAGKVTLSPRILLLWRFEELIMDQFNLLIQQFFRRTLQEGVESQKIFCLMSAASLLKGVPTGEQVLLSLLVNKLGDPHKKIASRAAHELRGLLRHHPAMQSVVAREVQQTVHRPHLSPRALYNCILFLNQLEFNRQDTALPSSLIQTYFRLFELAIADPKETEAKVNSRLLSALLTGVNRAHPFVSDAHDMEQHLDALYRVVHTAPPAACTQALLLLFHLVIGVEQQTSSPKDTRFTKAKGKKNQKDTSIITLSPKTSEHSEARRDRFYRALYAKLSDTHLLLTGKHMTQLFNLLYKSIKHDKNRVRVQACCKRLVSTVLHCSTSSTVAATLFLWHELAKTHIFLQEAYAEKLTGTESVLDVRKRDPRSAFVSADGGDSTSDENIEMCAPVWEMTLSKYHYHPSVVTFTSKLDAELNYQSDPLNDFSLAHFLDKLSYRNPKVAKPKENEKRAVVERQRTASALVPVNDSSFLEKTIVDPEDEFFHRFFVERARRDETKGIIRHKKSMKDDDDQSQEALDSAEWGDVDLDNVDDDFEKYEQAWTEDAEEEAFVESLSLSLMIDEDPDIDDPLYDEETNNNSEGEDGNNSEGSDPAAQDEVENLKDKEIEDDEEVLDTDGSDFVGTDNEENNVGDDADAFMDEDGDDSDNSSASPHDLEEGIIENANMDDESDASKEDEEDIFFQSALDIDSDDERSDVDIAENPRNTTAKKQNKKSESVFAAAEKYEEQIAASFKRLKRVLPDAQEKNAREEESKPKKRKRKKQK